MRRILLAITLLTCLAPTLWAQNVDGFVNKLRQKKDNNIQEKIYLHTDRANYTAGETIWIKSYTTVEIANHLSQLSRIGYIQLIDPQNKVVVEKKNVIMYGLGAADILLADTLTEGTYRLRAYTNWMRNYEEDYFFEKLITITNGRTDDVLTTTSKQQEDNRETYNISLRNVSRLPLSKVDVAYTFVENGKTVHRGSSRTDETGNLKIRVTEKVRGKDLVLKFENLNRRNVTKVVHTNILESDNSLQLFPEGGDLLSGFISRVGIKALMPNGKGIKASVDIIDSVGTVIASTETNHLGMGSVIMVPEENVKYQARARFEDNSELTIDMPESKTSGYSMMVNPNESSRIMVQLTSSNDKLSENEVYLLAHHEGRVFIMSKQKHNKNEIAFRLDRNQLPTGLITLTALDNNFRPLTERLVFNHYQGDFMKINVEAPNTVRSKRNLVDINMTVGTPEDSVRTASLSASVINLSKLTDTADVQTNILSGLLAESDIKGFIETPGYYFRDPENIKTNELDHLLITQGWRKFDWDKIDLVDSTKQFSAEQGISISGYARKLGRQAPVPQANVQLLSADNFMSILDTVANDEGYFEFSNLLFGDSTKFLISTRDKRGRNRIDVEHITPEKPTPGTLSGGLNDLNTLYNKEMTASKRFFDELERRGLLPNVIEIEEVVVTRERTQVPDHSGNLNGPGNADQVISWEDLEGCPTLEMCLNGRITGVMFRNGIPYNTRGDGEMQIVIDGMFVESDMLETIDPTEVASIEVLRTIAYTGIYGGHGGSGILVITLKTGAQYRPANFRPKGLLVVEPQGISSTRQFYKPMYDVAQPDGFTNDLRTTIHWEPYITTKRDGETSFDFYTSDEPGTYRLIIEGIDISGRIGRKVMDIEVK